MAAVSRPRVIFFKSFKSNDDYRSTFSEAGFGVDFAPVLEFKFVNEEILLSVLVNNDLQHSFDALIVTSARSMEAIGRLLETCGETIRQRILEIWSERQLFAVGDATVESSPLKFKSIHNVKSNSQHLAQYILNHFSSNKSSSLKPWRLLFLCSNIRRDALPTILSGGATDIVHLQELVVYTTITTLTTITDGTPPYSSSDESWWVFFSPSGVDAVISLLSPDTIPHSVRVAAIGQTSAEYLQLKGIFVEAVAEKPCPSSLLEAILAAPATNKITAQTLSSTP